MGIQYHTQRSCSDSGFVRHIPLCSDRCIDFGHALRLRNARKPGLDALAQGIETPLHTADKLKQTRVYPRPLPVYHRLLKPSPFDYPYCLDRKEPLRWCYPAPWQYFFGPLSTVNSLGSSHSARTKIQLSHDLQCPWIDLPVLFDHLPFAGAVQEPRSRMIFGVVIDISTVGKSSGD